jgi:hypothetical protein
MKLSDINKTIEVKIPNSDLIIWIKTSLSWSEQLELSAIKDQIEGAKYLIWKMIADWNLANDDGSKVAITKEVVDTFGINIIAPLKEHIDKIVGEKNQKKKIWQWDWLCFFKDLFQKSR